MSRFIAEYYKYGLLIIPFIILLYEKIFKINEKDEKNNEPSKWTIFLRIIFLIFLPVIAFVLGLVSNYIEDSSRKKNLNESEKERKKDSNLLTARWAFDTLKFRDLLDSSKIIIDSSRKNLKTTYDNLRKSNEIFSLQNKSYSLVKQNIDSTNKSLQVSVNALKQENLALNKLNTLVEPFSPQKIEITFSLSLALNKNEFGDIENKEFSETIFSLKTRIEKQDTGFKKYFSNVVLNNNEVKSFWIPNFYDVKRIINFHLEQIHEFSFYFFQNTDSAFHEASNFRTVINTKKSFKFFADVNNSPSNSVMQVILDSKRAYFVYELTNIETIKDDNFEKFGLPNLVNGFFIIIPPNPHFLNYKIEKIRLFKNSGEEIFNCLLDESERFQQSRGDVKIYKHLIKFNEVYGLPQRLRD